MGNKYGSKIKSSIKNRFGGKQEAPKDAQTLQQENRKRELDMISNLQTLLKEVESHSGINLSQKKITEFKIKERIAGMLNSLQTTRVTQTDEGELDKLITGFIDSLRTALKNGYEQMSYWSAVALTSSTLILRVEVPESDKDYEDLLYKRKAHYAETLATIIADARAIDEAIRKLERLNADCQAKKKELARRKDIHTALKQSEGGLAKLQNIRAKANDTGSMTDDERKVFENVLIIHELQDSIQTITEQIVIERDTLRTHDNALQRYQQQLATLPTVDDEKLAAKMKKLDEIFVQRLNDQVSRNLEIAKQERAYAEGISSVAKRVHQANAQRFNEAMDNLNMEDVDNAIIKLEGAALIKQAQETARRIEKIQRDIEENIHIDTVDEPIVITEPEPITEVDEDPEHESEYDYE